MPFDTDPWSGTRPDSRQPTAAVPLRGRAGGLFEEPYATGYADAYTDAYTESYADSSADPLDRLTHLVFLDGRLLDAWTEPAHGTRWAAAADRADRDRLPPDPPSPPPYRQALDWLAGVCGGPARVAGLDDAPLTDERIDLPDDLPDLRSRHRLASAAELIDSVCAGLFDAETSYAARHALLALWADAPEVVLGAASPAQLTGGILWAVGKANGLFGPRGRCTQAAVQEALALTQPISGPGRRVANALQGLLVTSASRPYWSGIPDFEPLGRPELLISATRRQLVRLRDRAHRARETAEGPAGQASRNPSATS